MANNERVASLFWAGFLLLVTAVLLYLLQELILLVVLGLILAVFWTSLADAIAPRLPPRTPHMLILLTTVALTILVIGVALWLLIQPISDQLTELSRQLPDILRSLQDRLAPFFKRFGFNASNFDLSKIAGISGNVLASGMGVLLASIHGLIGAVTVFFMGIFFALEPALYRRGFLSLFPPSFRPDLDALLLELHHTLRLWMRGTALAMVTIAAMTTLLLWVAGIPYFLVFGLAAGVFDIVPYLGPVLAFTGPFALALTISMTKTAWVLTAYVVAQNIEGHVVIPYFMAKQVSIPPALTIVAIFAMQKLFGFLGLILAAPILACILVVARFSIAAREKRRFGPQA